MGKRKQRKPLQNLFNHGLEAFNELIGIEGDYHSPESLSLEQPDDELGRQWLEGLTSSQREALLEYQQAQIRLAVQAAIQHQWDVPTLTSAMNLIVNPVGATAIPGAKPAADGQHRHNSKL